MNYISKVQVSDNTIYDIKDSISRQKILSQKYYGDPDIIPTSQNDFTFSVNSGVASVTGYTGSGGEVVIPYEYVQNENVYAVTSVGDSAFEACTDMTNITIPNSVTSIGESAFRNCNGLTSIAIPNNMTSIDFRVFEGCGGLTSVTMPESVTSIGNSTFRKCTNLTSITILNSVTSINNSAFRDCNNLTIRCYKGSTADTYAQTNNIPVEYLDVKDNIIVNGSVTNAKLSTDVQNAIAAGNYFGICTDAEITMNKTVTIPNLPTPIPDGTSIRVKFTNKVKNYNSPNYLKLNVNNSGNKYVLYANNDYAITFPSDTITLSNGILNFTYDASEDFGSGDTGVWRLEYGYASMSADAMNAEEADIAYAVSDGSIHRTSLDSDLTKRVPYFGICTTAANVNAKRVTISGFPTTLSDGMTVSIMFQNGLYGTYVDSSSTNATIDFSTNGTQPKTILVNGVDGTTVCNTNKQIIDQGGVVTMTYRSSDDVWVINGKEWVERAVYADFIKDGNVIRTSLDSELGAKVDLVEFTTEDDEEVAIINPDSTIDVMTIDADVEFPDNAQFIIGGTAYTSEDFEAALFSPINVINASTTTIDAHDNYEYRIIQDLSSLTLSYPAALTR